MASFITLPVELKLMVCEHLDSTSLKALALTCRHIDPAASDMHKKNMHIDASGNVGVVARRVLGHLFHQTNNTSRAPPRVAIAATAFPHANRLIRHASLFKSLTISLEGCNQRGLQVNQGFINECLRLQSELDPHNTFAGHILTTSLLLGEHGRLLLFLMEALQRLRVLEVMGGVGWQQSRFSTLPLDIRKVGWTNPDLEILRFTTSPPSIFGFWDLRAWSLHTLEITSMTITREIISSLGTGLSISHLYVRDCFLPKDALRSIVRACRALKSFEYTVGNFWVPHFADCHVAGLIASLRTHHVHTLYSLTLRTLGHRASSQCQFVEDVVQLKKLRTLVLNEDHFHFNHNDSTKANCKKQRRVQSYDLLKAYNSCRPSVPSAIDIISGLTNSLQQLELFVWDDRMMTTILQSVLVRMEHSRKLPNLHTLKMTLVLSEAFNEYYFNRYKCLLQQQAARIQRGGQRRFNLHLDCLPPGSFEAAYQPPWKP